MTFSMHARKPKPQSKGLSKSRRGVVTLVIVGTLTTSPCIAETPQQFSAEALLVLTRESAGTAQNGAVHFVRDDAQYDTAGALSTSQTVQLILKLDLEPPIANDLSALFRWDVIGTDGQTYSELTEFSQTKFDEVPMGPYSVEVTMSHPDFFQELGRVTGTVQIEENKEHSVSLHLKTRVAELSIINPSPVADTRYAFSLIPTDPKVSGGTATMPTENPTVGVLLPPNESEDDLRYGVAATLFAPGQVPHLIAFGIMGPVLPGELAQMVLTAGQGFEDCLVVLGPRECAPLAGTKN